MNKGLKLWSVMLGLMLLSHVAWPKDINNSLKIFGLITVDRGKAAPNFSLPKLWGGKGSLEEYRGMVVMLYFWATW